MSILHFKTFGFGSKLLFLAIRIPIERVEHVEEDDWLHYTKIVEQHWIAFLVVEEEATVDAKDDELC